MKIPRIQSSDYQLFPKIAVYSKPWRRRDS